MKKLCIQGAILLVVLFPLGCGKTPDNVKTIPELITMVQDPNPEVQVAGLIALQAVAAEAKDAVPVLIQALKSPHAQVRSSAASVLGEMGPEAKDAVPALAEALAGEGLTPPAPPPPDAEGNEPDYRAYYQNYVMNTQRAAATALGKMGPEAKAALPALEKFSQTAGPAGDDCGSSSVKAAISKVNK